jgi:F0F1-type ATP synthase membrane subunit b/b'
MDSSFFILISFLVFAYIFFKKIWPGIVDVLDDYISTIQRRFNEIQISTNEQEKLEIVNQKKLQNLQKEIEIIKSESLKKIEFLKQKINEDMECQYVNRQKSFQQATKRIKSQQRKALQSRCVDEIFEKIMQRIEKNSSLEDEYMVSVTEIIKADVASTS